MKKVLMFLTRVFVAIVSLTEQVFAATNVGGIINDFVVGYGGWAWLAFIVLAFVAVWIIRATKTTKDDAILDKYIMVAVEYAAKVMPKDSKINRVKFVANALGKFSEIYTKTNELPPDAKFYDKAKQLIETIAEEKQVEQLKNSNG